MSKLPLSQFIAVSLVATLAGTACGPQDAEGAMELEGYSTTEAPPTDPITVASGLQYGQWYSFIARHSIKCMDVRGKDVTNEANIQQYSCTGADNQKFVVVDAGGGYVNLVAKHSNKCVDVYAKDTRDGVNIQQFTCTGNYNQAFQVVDAGDGYVNFVARHSGKCIEVYASRTGNEVNIQQFTCTGADNQKFLPF